MSPKRSHIGLARLQGERDSRSLDHPVAPSSPDPRRASCLTCGRSVHYVRRTYGPRGRAGHWQHTGDGLGQYRSWGIGR